MSLIKVASEQRTKGDSGKNCVDESLSKEPVRRKEEQKDKALRVERACCPDEGLVHQSGVSMG